MKVMRVLAVVAFSAPVLAQAAGQTAPPTRAGARPILDRAQEIALARSAAPASVSAGARVLVFTGAEHVVADRGSNGVTCVVNRSWPAALEPHCYDREASETMLPIELRRNELRHRGVPEAEIEREIADGLASGLYRLPRRPAVSYMMSAAQVLYDDSGNRVGAWKPHLMIYYPYLSSDDVGFGRAPDMRVGMVSDAGTPFSTLIVIMPAPVPVAARP